MPIETTVLGISYCGYVYCYMNENCRRNGERVSNENQMHHEIQMGRNTYLNACRRVVTGEPSLIWPKFKQFCPFILQVSKRFFGGSTVSTEVAAAASLLGRIASSSSSKAGRRRFRSNNKK